MKSTKIYNLIIGLEIGVKGLEWKYFPYSIVLASDFGAIFMGGYLYYLRMASGYVEG